MENIQDKICKNENEIIESLNKNSILILSSSIIEIESLKNKENIECMLPIMHLQTAIELLIKYYVVTIYGFYEILTDKYKKIKKDNPIQYLENLNKKTIKTLGFNELKKFLEKERDCFSYVIKQGTSPFFGIEYDYLEGVFEKFQELRNQFVHLGINLTEDDKKWLEYDFYAVIIFFASILMREIDNLKLVQRYKKIYTYIPSLDDDNLNETPIDILKKHLSSEAVKMLYKSKFYEGSILDIAENISGTGDTYKCSECGLNVLALDVKDTDGWTKCLGCGLMYHSGYTNCFLCGGKDSVTFDIDNIECNYNVMPGYCHSCENLMKVYQCPICGCEYSYNSKEGIKNWIFDCCKANFKDRFYINNDGAEY